MLSHGENSKEGYWSEKIRALQQRQTNDENKKEKQQLSCKKEWPPCKLLERKNKMLYPEDLKAKTCLKEKQSTFVQGLEARFWECSWNNVPVKKL